MNDSSDIVARVNKSLDSRNEVIRELFEDQKIRNSIISLIVKNGGDKDKALELLTNAIIAFVKQCKSPVFELRHSINTYLYSIVRYDWIKESKKEKALYLEEDRREHVDYEESIESKIIGSERMRSLRTALSKLDEKCRDVLTMWSNQIKMREIAIRMEYSSEGFARKKKHKCLQKLKLMVKDL